MKVTQEKLPASQVGLDIEISPEQSQQSYEQVIQNFARAANIPGFRKGKVPRQILLQRLGTTQVKAAALEDLIQNGVQEAIKQKDIQALGQPQLRSSFEELVKQYEPGKPLLFSAAVDVQPEVTLAQYKGLQVQAEEVKYDAASVEKVLEENRSEMGTLLPVEGRSAQLGDVAVVDFQGHLASNGDSETQPQEIPGASATDFEVELQAGRFIEGFIDGIVGMKPGETKEVAARFPAEYPQQDVAGKAAVFTVTLKEIKEKELPELDDDFAKQVSEFDTIEELRSSLEAKFQAEAENKTKANKQQAISNELLKHLEVELPETLIAQEVDAMLTQTAVQLSQQGVDVKKLFTQENIAQLRERSRLEATERLKRTMALQEVAKRESLQVTGEAVAARSKELMTQYAGQDIDKERLKEIVEEELLTEKVFEWLEAHITIELVPAGSLSSTKPEVTDEAQSAAVEVVPEGFVVNAAEMDTPEEAVAASDSTPETSK